MKKIILIFISIILISCENNTNSKSILNSKIEDWESTFVFRIEKDSSLSYEYHSYYKKCKDTIK